MTSAQMGLIAKLIVPRSVIHQPTDDPLGTRQIAEDALSGSNADAVHEEIDGAQYPDGARLEARPRKSPGATGWRLPFFRRRSRRHRYRAMLGYSPSKHSCPTGKLSENQTNGTLPSASSMPLGCTFDLDVASPAARRTFVPASRFITERGLETEWHGFVWMNPPFGGRNAIAPWGQILRAWQRFSPHT